MLKIKYKKLFLNIITSLFSMLFFFLCIEGVLSLAKIGDVGKFSGWGYNSHCCGDLRPNQQIIAKVVPDHPYLIETNSLGLRNKNIIKIKPDKPRILAVGDSFTFGPYVANEETWPSYLEKELKEKAEVLNAGAAGYSIQEELDYIKDKGVKLEPSLIILQFFPNDITDFNKDLKRQGRGSFLSNSDFIYPIFNFFRDRSRLMASLLEIQIKKEAWKLKPEIKEIKKTNMEVKYNSNLNHDFFQKYKEIFKKFTTFVKDSNIRLMVVFIPEIQQSKDISLSIPNKFMEKLCAEENIPFLDLHKQFVDFNNTDVLYLTPWNAHLSKHGNQIVAKEIEKFIIENKLLKKYEQ